MSNGATPDFDQATYYRDRIKQLERQVVGLEAIRDQFVRVLAGYIVDTEARRQIELMPQAAFMDGMDAYMTEYSRSLRSRPGEGVLS